MRADRVVTRLDVRRLTEMAATAQWLANAVGALDRPRTETDPASEKAFETTWTMRSRDGSFTGYAQLSRAMDGVVTAVLRDTSTSPPQDDVALVEPPRRDGADAIADPSDHAELRRVVDRWIRYMRTASVIGQDFDTMRIDDVRRAALLKTVPMGGTTCAAFVRPPTAHRRMDINDDPTAFDDEPDVEAAIDGRWSDVVEIGTVRTSARRTWTIVSAIATAVIGDPDPIERLRIHQAILAGPATRA